MAGEQRLKALNDSIIEFNKECRDMILAMKSFKK
jgi:hypothetical protein